MVTNRTHAETLVDCLGMFIDARRIYIERGHLGVPERDAQALLNNTRDKLVLAIEMTLNDLVEAKE